MKSKLVIDDNKDDLKYTPLIKIEADDKTYLIYTKGEHSDSEDLICYAGCYIFSNGVQKIKPIEDDYTLELLDNILVQLESNINKKEGRE